jgi:hypothetical protein
VLGSDEDLQHPEPAEMGRIEVEAQRRAAHQRDLGAIPGRGGKEALESEA